MTRPLVGITTYARNEGNQLTLPAEYADAVYRAGGVPLLVPPGLSDFQELLVLLDAVVLAGGGDVDPALYHGQPHEAVYGVDPERDRSEMALVLELVPAGLPTLAICRGLQLVNVALGGTLIEHLPDVVGEEVLHRLPPREPTEHSVFLKAGSRLATILGTLELRSVSWHHQAARKVAPGLEAVAHAPDGTIEALEMPAHPWLTAVQWHPERTAASDPTQHRLFEALIEAAQRPKKDKGTKARKGTASRRSGGKPMEDSSCD